MTGLVVEIGQVAAALRDFRPKFVEICQRQIIRNGELFTLNPFVFARNFMLTLKVPIYPS